MNKQQITEKIQTIENKIQSTKATLKSWAKQIGQYHKTLKELSCQLATLKEQIIMKKNNNNNPNKTPGGNK